MTKFEALRKKIDTYCGLSCEDCEYREKAGCKGCIATKGRPFHGECAVASCAIEKKRGFCGECESFPCELLESYSNDEAHKDSPKGKRIQRCKEMKAALVQEARKGVDPISPCGHHCDHCFLGQWCGGCRSVYPHCSFAGLFEDGVCPNVSCSRERGLDGCFACEELSECKKGYYGADDFYTAKAAALFLQKHGKEAYSKVHRLLEERGEKYPGNAKSPEEALAFLEACLKE